MSDPIKCQRCGAALPRRAPEGLCPRCLMESAVRLAVAAGDGDADRPDSAPAAGPPSPALLAGRFGNYELLERVASGGMGVVYKARQIGLERIVAIKVLPFGPFTREELVRRFQVEAGAAAKLRHPNIVTIHEVGHADGYPFFSMEYVEGPTLAELVRDGPLPVARAVRLVRAIAEAIHCAHRQGVLHRDLKPSNVLLDSLDQPRVSDFGLAKEFGVPALTPSRPPGPANTPTTHDPLTLTGQALGSPNYMPPEQAEGRGADIGPRSDLYGLGAILYFLLTGRPPFASESTVATLRQVVQNDPVPPRLLNPALPRDLDTICLRCLEKDPGRRYATAQEVAEELDRFQRSEPILARPITVAERGWRLCRRHPAVAGLLASLLVVVAAGLAATLWQWRRVELSSARLAETVTRLEIDRAEDLLEHGETSEGLAQLASVLRRTPQNQVAATRIVAVLTQRRFLQPTHTVIQDDFVGKNSAFAQHGDWLVTSTNRGATLQLWDTREGPRLHRLIPCGDAVRVASFRGDGRQLAAATADGSLLVFDIPGGARQAEASTSSTELDAAGPHRIGGYIDRVVLSPDGAQVIAHVSGPNSDDWKRARLMVIDSATGRVLRSETNLHWAAFSPDGRSLVTVGGQTAQLRIPSTWEPVGPPLRHSARISTAEFSPDSRRLVTASADRAARLWSVETGEPIGAPMRHDRQVLAAVFSPDGHRVLTMMTGRFSRLWDGATGSPVGPRFEHTRSIGQDSFSADSALVVTCSESEVRLRDAATGALRAEPLDIGQSVPRARFIGAGRRVFPSNFGGAVRVWNAPADAASGHRLTNRAEVGAVAVGPNAAFIAAGIEDRTARVWNAGTLEPIAVFDHPSQVTRIAFDPGGTRLVTAAADPVARVWELASGRLLAELRHRGVVLDARFSPDGRRLATGSEDGSGRLWRTDTFEPCSDPLQHRGHVRGVAFHPAGTILATAGTDSTVRLWSSLDGTPVGEPLRHSNWVYAVTFSPNGQVLAAYGSETGVRLWSGFGVSRPAEAGRPMAAEPESLFLRHEAHVDCVGFDPAGARVVTASDNGTAHIWSATTGAALARPLRHDGPLTWVEFSPDGRLVLTASDDGTARVWDATTGHALTDPWRHEGSVSSAQWSPWGDFVVTGSDDRTVRVWPVECLGLGAAPAWLADLAEAVGGKRLLGDQLHAPVASTEFLLLRESLLDRAGPGTHRRWLEDFLGTTPATADR